MPASTKKGDVMKMKGSLSASIALLVIFVFCTSLHCQNADDVVSGMSVDGRVVSVAPQKSQIIVRSSIVMTFSVPTNSKIINDDGFGMQLSDVGVGKYVTVNYHDDRSGNHIMDFMEVQYNR